ncbi:helix-turn-helix domain-containing protein [Chitinophaga sp. S165]|uniref:helix-turn-helix domain-containing protein n=1 Tax=Chitinophaga sp. S165 TaxID=2135462 RepID=UPI000D718AF5|nr:AraC family transcriptional regulator [Chitinophaga sp. S165]PWV53322.1 AraC-like DNA-binding protein [Chitinophaga sp. S165]
MPKKRGFLDRITQHEKLAIRINTDKIPAFPADIQAILSGPHKEPHYFIELMVEGEDNQMIDLRNYKVASSQLLFVLPNQLHWSGRQKQGSKFFNIVFDENCLSLLPQTYRFLLNPLNNSLITVDQQPLKRLSSLLISMSSLLEDEHAGTEILLAYLNAFLTECNTLYFSGHRIEVKSNKLEKYYEFQQYIENNLTHPGEIHSIAEKLAVSTNFLYQIVKQYSGHSPKEFLINRIMLEAQRKLYHEHPSIKTLAYDLGFSDPDYFSRLFKKTVGKSITQFISELKDL